MNQDIQDAFSATRTFEQEREIECVTGLEILVHSLPDPNTPFPTPSPEDTCIDLDLQCDTDDVHQTALTGYNSRPVASQKQKNVPLDDKQVEASSGMIFSETGESDSHHLLNTPTLFPAIGTHCTICNILFSNHQALDSHMKDKHRIKEEFSNFICLICGKDFRNAQSLRRHKKLHNKNYLVNYLESHPETTFKCSFCPYVGKTKRLLNDHIVKLHSKDRKIYRCNRCPFSCLKFQTLSLHQRRHEEEPKFACDQCGKLYLTMSILKRHAKTHVKTTLYTCPILGCGKSFNMKGRLTDHTRTVHSSSNQLPNSFVESNVIVIHDVILPANEIENFQKCSASSQTTYKRPDQLHDDTSNKVTPQCFLSDFQNEGEKMHHSANTILLDTCLEKNSNSGHIDGQISKKNKEMKFVCNWINCGKKFRDNHNLRMHSFTHTGEMQRACTVCRYRCVQKSALDSHMAKHRKEGKTLELKS